MKLLLDTHVILWALADPERIDAPVRARLRDRRNTLYASSASVWEIEIKRAIGKLSMPDDLEEQLAAAGIAELPIRHAHVRALRGLPALHRDPFDRMLAAQTIAERLVLVTADPIVLGYPIRTLRAG